MLITFTLTPSSPGRSGPARRVVGLPQRESQAPYSAAPWSGRLGHRQQDSRVLQRVEAVRPGGHYQQVARPAFSRVLAGLQPHPAGQDVDAGLAGILVLR